MSPTVLAALCFAVTVACYYLGKYAYARWQKPWLLPLVTVPALLILLVVLSGIPYSIYFADTRWLVWLLGPATVAFALPIYHQRELLRRYPLSLAAGVLVGVLLGLASSWLLARLFHLPDEVARSLLPRSVSTPFALLATDAFGGSRQLTGLFVIITGVFGMVLGEGMLVLLGLRSKLARGALFGAAAHAAGTVKAREIGSEEGAVASLVMMFAGILMVLLAPWFAHWVT
ncbi:LrgB family protein [Chitinimonas naiadis]